MVMSVVGKPRRVQRYDRMSGLHVGRRLAELESGGLGSVARRLGELA